MKIPKRLLRKILRDCKRSGSGSRAGDKNKKFLICFPFDEQHQKIAFRVFASVIKSHQENCLCLISENARGILRELSDDSIIIVPIPEDIQRNPVLPSGISGKIQSEYYTVAVDLNTGFHPYTAAAVLQTNAPKRIGFQSEYSDNFFNIQMTQKKDDPVESSYRYIHHLLVDALKY
ncbi:MAG TPA: hypothetical protein DHW42_06565 [Candidatus Marinimicrobia bacterium]|nr:hypothetical protein [Candidatus Neomarinimicrobiota bacterium]